MQGNQKSSPQRLITQMASIAFFVGLLVWLALFIGASTQIRDAAVGSQTVVQFGPLVLNQVGKTAIDGGGFQATFSFEAGLLWYFIAWVGLGALVGYVRYTLAKNKA